MGVKGGRNECGGEGAPLAGGGRKAALARLHLVADGTRDATLGVVTMRIRGIAIGLHALAVS